MPAFNFKPEFIHAVKTGAKFSTMRETARCKVGNKMFLFTGMRTKNCRKLGVGICTGVYPVKLSFGNGTLDIHRLVDETPFTIIDLKNMEGFETLEHMYDFFEAQYGLPKTLYLHTWKLTTEA